MTKWLTSLLAISITISSTAMAQEAEVELDPLPKVELEKPEIIADNGEKQTYLEAGDEAPFSGVLLNPPAVALILTEYEALVRRAEAALEKQHQQDQNRLHLEVNRLRLQLEAVERRAEVRIEGLKKENKRLQQVHQDLIDKEESNFWFSKVGKFLKYGLVVIGSAAAGFVIGTLATN